MKKRILPKNYCTTNNQQSDNFQKINEKEDLYFSFINNNILVV